MARKFANRVVETTQTTGTGTLELIGPQAGYRAFSQEIASGDQIDYVIEDDPANPTEYEIGRGTYTSGANRLLSRESVFGSSNNDNKISLKAGRTYTVTASLLKDAVDRPPSDGFHNRVINGDFDIWQRADAPGAASQTASGFWADRWSVLESGVPTLSQRRQAHALGEPLVPSNPRYFHRTQFTGGSGVDDHVVLTHAIESVRTLAGRSATLTFYARADTARHLSVELLQVFGTGGMPSATVTGIGTTKFALSSAWTKCQTVVDLPDLFGKAVGTDEDDYVGIYFWLEAGSGWDGRTNALGHQTGVATIDIAHVSLLEGNVVGTDSDPFTARHIGQERALCQRYCEVVTLPSDIDGRIIGHSAGSTILDMGLHWSTRKRTATPTVTLNNITQFRVGVANITPVGGFIVVYVHENGAVIRANHSGLTPGVSGLLRGGQDASIVIEDELVSNSQVLI